MGKIRARSIRPSKEEPKKPARPAQENQVRQGRYKERGEDDTVKEGEEQKKLLRSKATKPRQRKSLNAVTAQTLESRAEEKRRGK